ncbi:MAG: hypothetical protein E2604_15300 [Flavobacterium sp.]|nr:hypothetical protein [Flavobacterium sp.]
MDSIEIVLRKDSRNQEINLDHMSIESSEALKEILESLIAIAKYEKEQNNLNLQIGIEKGSACEKLIGDESSLRTVYNKIEEASRNTKNRDNFYVNNLKVIQSNLDKKTDFSIVYKSNGKSEEITELFKNQFKIKRQKNLNENSFHVEFIKGKLMQNGGTNPNFHLQIPSGIITIDCDEKEAQKVNRYLYKDTYISAWVQRKNNDKQKYKFCDLYTPELSIEQFNDFGEFFKSIHGKKGTEPLHSISKKLESFYNIKNYGNAAKFIRIFNNKEVNPNYLKTILVLSKNLENAVDSDKDRAFIEALNNLRVLLNKKLGKK